MVGAGPWPHYQICAVVAQIIGSNQHRDDLPVFVEIYSLHGGRKVLDDCHQPNKNTIDLGNPVILYNFLGLLK